MEFTEARTRLRRNDDIERKSGVYWRNLADRGSCVDGGWCGAQPAALAGGGGSGWGTGGLFCGEKTAGAVEGIERRDAFRVIRPGLAESAKSEPGQKADGGYPSGRSELVY